jgi:hypothetical protein
MNLTIAWQGIGRLGAGLTTVMALLSCGGSSTDPLATFKNQKLAWAACEPSGYADTLTALGSRAQCTDMRVPLDYAEPARGEVSVALLRVSAEVPAQRLGAILFNPGVPGAAAARYQHARSLGRHGHEFCHCLQ